MKPSETAKKPNETGVTLLSRYSFQNGDGDFRRLPTRWITSPIRRIANANAAGISDFGIFHHEKDGFRVLLRWFAAFCVSKNSSTTNSFAAKETAATSSLQGIECKHFLLLLRSKGDHLKIVELWDRHSKYYSIWNATPRRRYGLILVMCRITVNGKTAPPKSGD